MMNIQEKSIALAELMGWGVDMTTTVTTLHPQTTGYFTKGFHVFLEPYENTEAGLAQFAAILLKYPEVIGNFIFVTHNYIEVIDRRTEHFTQASILDEILRMEASDE